MSLRKPLRLLGLALAAGLLCVTQGAAQPASPTLEQRLIRLEEGQKALAERIDGVDQRIDDLRLDTNGRFDDLRADMNAGFDDLRADMNARFADLQFWLQTTFGAVVLVIAGLVAQWLLMWKRLIRLETAFTDHLHASERDLVIVQLRQELSDMAQRLERMEGMECGHA